MMTHINIIEKIQMYLPNNIGIKIKREGSKTMVKMNRGRKYATLHLDGNKASLKLNKKIISIDYDFEKILKKITSYFA